MASNINPIGPLAEFSIRPQFQLSLPTTNLTALRSFYVDVLGSRIVRDTADELEFSFFGGVLVAYRVDVLPTLPTCAFGDRQVPLPNFGLIMGWEDWHRAVDHLNYVGVIYRVPPTMVSAADGSQLALFAIADPSKNCLSFRANRRLDSSPSDHDRQ
jgi:uncharacterized protein